MGYRFDRSIRLAQISANSPLEHLQHEANAIPRQCSIEALSTDLTFSLVISLLSIETRKGLVLTPFDSSSRMKACPAWTSIHVI